MDSSTVSSADHNELSNSTWKMTSVADEVFLNWTTPATDRFGPSLEPAANKEWNCVNWLPVNHFFFQLANTFFFLSYLAPNGIYGILYLRITLALGSLLFALWGYGIICALDTFIWNVLFLVINAVHTVSIIYMLRPIRFPKHFNGVYKNVFAPLKVTRLQFKKVLDCMKEVRSLKPREMYAFEGKTNVDKLSLVMSGKFLVSQNEKPLNFVWQYQFLDSPEWFGMSTDECFQVSITAIEDSKVLVWNRDKLKLTINGDAFLQAVFDHILGKDVVSKLTQVNEKCVSNGVPPETADVMNEKVHLVVQRNESTVVSVVTKQLQSSELTCRGILPEQEPLLLRLQKSNLQSDDGLRETIC